jgi:hypothetical protein
MDRDQEVEKLVIVIKRIIGEDEWNDKDGIYDAICTLC